MSKKPIGPSKLSLSLGDIPQSYQSKEQEARVTELLQQFNRLIEELFAEIHSPLDARYSAGSLEEKKNKEDVERFINAILSDDAKSHLRLISYVVNSELRAQLLETFIRSLFNMKELQRFASPAETVISEEHSRARTTNAANAGFFRGQQLKQQAIDGWQAHAKELIPKIFSTLKGDVAEKLERNKKPSLDDIYRDLDEFWRRDDLKLPVDRVVNPVLSKWAKSGQFPEIYYEVSALNS